MSTFYYVIGLMSVALGIWIKGPDHNFYLTLSIICIAASSIIGKIDDLKTKS